MALRVKPPVRVKVKTETTRHTVDDVWAMEDDPANQNRYFYLIDGELFEDPMAKRTHGNLQLEIGVELKLFVRARNLGEAHTEVGYYASETMDTYLVPDVAFASFERLGDSSPDEYAPVMPELAVEIKSPSNSMPELRRKAETYLRHGSEIVWLVLPEREGVEEWTLDADGRMQSQFINRNGALDGGNTLPGFSLPLRQLFPDQDKEDDHAS